MGINTNLQNIETKLTNLKTNLDGYLVNKGAVAGSTLTQSIDNVDTIQTGGGGGNSFDVIGYNATPKYIQDNIDYSKTIYDNWDPNQTDLSYRFKNDKKLMFMPMVDTSNVTTMEDIFNGCNMLTTIPQLDTSQVTIMQGMFGNCSNLTTIPQLDTSKVTDMSNMFGNCSKLTTITQLNTSQVTNMNKIFYNCRNLTTIPQLDTSQVTNMQYMFGGCNMLTAIPQLDTSQVTNMYNLFYYCSKLSYINIINLGAKSEITNIDFSKCDWGNESRIVGAKQSLIDSLITNSFDRTAAGYGPCTLTLSTNTKGYLTEEEKAAITAKGFTIA